MKCANCGTEIKAGRLYCEQCGEEIKIVPEFDLEFEKQIKETLDNLAKDVASETENENEPSAEDFSVEDSFDETEQEDIEFSDSLKDILNQPQFEWLKRLHGKVLIAILFLLAVLGVCSVLLLKHSSVDTYEYQYEQALMYADNHQMSEAISCMERALALNPDNEDAQLLLADYYYEDGQKSNAILLMREVITLNPDNIEEVYDKLISIYIKENAFSEIGDLLKDCNNVKILSKYNSYVANVPEFNKIGGDYDELISITMKGNTSGSVYYTLDGTEPDGTAEEYDHPILLESGKYVIKAIFINTYGIQSDVVTMEYNINIIPPEAPTINLESGTYDEPQLIEIIYETNAKVYYTVDGSVPTTDSERYTEPLEMPVGISNFSFVVVNDKGAVSETVQRTYQLTMAAYISPELAKQVLLNNLQVNNIIADQAGHIVGRLGYNTYEVKTAVKLNEVVYYILSENYVDTTGNVHEAVKLYALDAITGDVFNAYKIGESQYTLSSL